MSNYTDMHTTCIACSIEPPRVMFFFSSQKILKNVNWRIYKENEHKVVRQTKESIKVFWSFTYGKFIISQCTKYSGRGFNCLRGAMVRGEANIMKDCGFETDERRHRKSSSASRLKASQNSKNLVKFAPPVKHKNA